MGRTKRTRLRNRNYVESNAKTLDYAPEVISLKKWLVKGGWENSNELILKFFSLTGRGVTAKKNLKSNDTLIAVPYSLLITYSTVIKLYPEISKCGQKLKIHDLLTYFLISERQKAENSLWKHYINSLPTTTPTLPWLCSTTELESLPAYLKIPSRKARQDFTESLQRLKKSICLKSDCVLDGNLFKWAYVMVNTRAVYVDPQLVCKMSDDKSSANVLSDSPCMALCPYLDMFNHHYSAETEAEVDANEGEAFYKLRSLTSYKKYEQIFISYGAHDNLKLLMEYGFFIPGNPLECVRVTMEEVVEKLKMRLNSRQYKFVVDHEFNKNLYISSVDLSFNLKALLFVSFNDDVRDFNEVVYSANYPEDCQRKMREFAHVLLNYKCVMAEEDLENFEKSVGDLSANVQLLRDFLCYRLEFITELCTNKYNI